MESHCFCVLILSIAPSTWAICCMHEWMNECRVWTTEICFPLSLYLPTPPPHTRMGASELANGHVSAFFQQRLTQLSHHFHQICPCLLASGHTYKQCSKKGHPCHDILLQSRGNKIKQACSSTQTQANKQTKGLNHCGITVTVVSHRNSSGSNSCQRQWMPVVCVLEWRRNCVQFFETVNMQMADESFWRWPSPAYKFSALVGSVAFVLSYNSNQRTLLLKYHMNKTVYFKMNSESRGQQERWKFVCVIYNRVLISTVGLCFGFLRLRGKAFTGNVSMLPWPLLVTNDGVLSTSKFSLMAKKRHVGVRRECKND